MTIHKVFAERLRKECNRHRSISAVCAGARVNRQQFNKYLAGQSIPNGRTLARICEFLKIEQQELFVSEGDQPPHFKTDPSAHQKHSGEQNIATLAGLFDTVSAGAVSEARDALRPGIYECYFPLEGTSHHLMRSLLIVRRFSFGLTFTRFTAFPENPASLRFIARSKHDGFVLANEREVLLIARNRLHHSQISFISLERASGQVRELMTGVSVVRTSHDAMASRVCLLHRNSNGSYRAALKTIGPVHISADTLDPMVRSAMFDSDLDQPNHIQCHSIAETMLRLVRAAPWGGVATQTRTDPGIREIA